MIEVAQYESVAPGVSRTDHAVRAIAHLAEQRGVGARLGTKRELQEWCGVAKGTFNEALRILQSRRVIAVRPGPGGGLFVASPTPIARLGNSILSLDAVDSDVADAVRLRDALDPLLIEDALAHGSATDVARMRTDLASMLEAIERAEATEFVHANWRLHSTIASVSPNAILKSVYLGLLDLIESHTVSVEPAEEEPLWDYIRRRYQLHVDLVDAIDRRDGPRALRLIEEHNMTKGASSSTPDQ